MSITAARTGVTEEEQATVEAHLPAEIDWDKLNKSRFFLLGAALFSGVSTSLYPAIVVKTRLQVSPGSLSSFSAASSILRHDGFRGFYAGFSTSLAGTIPARALYMTVLEVTKSTVGTAALRFGMVDSSASAVAGAVGGLTAAIAAQVVWTPIDVVTQRLMVQTGMGIAPSPTYSGGMDAFKKILRSDGLRGLYRGFGMSILTYAPSNAVWWASYSVSQRVIWDGIGCWVGHLEGGGALKPNQGTVAAVQGVSAAMAGGAAALVTMPLDTVKTRMQVMDEGKGMMSIARAMSSLFKEGGWAACYRGLGPRWASMSLSSTAMITTYEFLKRLSAKNRDCFA
ncbi:hypothetical protein HPP92_005890 [Vanilla planifolia]|uniref:Mitochondrial carrier protein n=1 Tax=Vanilla planifolia TaxID=51239 RepID=A0A835RUH7_VANPL|nr:hypothetical protein HPP92_006150 [Vanilla planifolia]KAG0494896.1 hypothetical protein HPP92_005890 [Vanilla planifolia]